jgi:hypothetical protein
LAFLNLPALEACDETEIPLLYGTFQPASHCSPCLTKRLEEAVGRLEEEVGSLHKPLDLQLRCSRETLRHQRHLCDALAELQPSHLEPGLRDLVNSRFHSDMLINSVSVIFSGRGVLFNFDKTLTLQGRARVMTLFSPRLRSAEMYRTTLYERLGIFLDTVFGLKTDEEGLPPPPERNGNLSSLLTYKFNFVLGPQRDGLGEDYGYSNTSDHFSDNPDSKIIVPGFRNGAGIIADPTQPLQKVSEFFESYHATTDYERLKALFDVLTIITD